ncbi:MAG: hypothetical protein AAGI68_13935 [Planctomycetota bacterium]
MLVALGIFAFGFLAIAAIFPVGLLMQKQTTNDILAVHVAESGTAIVQAFGLTNSDVVDYFTPGPDGLAPNQMPAYPGPFTTFTGSVVENRVKALRFVDPVDTTQELIDRYSIRDRSAPTTTQTIADREFFWVPLMRDVDGEAAPPSGKTTNQVIVYLCVLQRESGVIYTKTTEWADSTIGDPTIPGLVRADVTPTTATSNTVTNVTNAQITFSDDTGLVAGDLILDSEGIQYTVLVSANNGRELTLSSFVGSQPEWFWYAPAGTSTSGSPLVRIKQFVFELTP